MKLLVLPHARNLVLKKEVYRIAHGGRDPIFVIAESGISGSLPLGRFVAGEAVKAVRCARGAQYPLNGLAPTLYGAESWKDEVM